MTHAVGDKITLSETRETEIVGVREVEMQRESALLDVDGAPIVVLDIVTVPSRVRDADGVHEVLDWNEDGPKVFALAEPSAAYLAERAAEAEASATAQRLARESSKEYRTAAALEAGDLKLAAAILRGEA